MNSNMLNNIYIATFSGNALETARKYGFGVELNDLCISSNLDPEKKSWVMARMRDEISKAGRDGKRTIMHGPFTELTPAAIDSRAIDLMRERYISTISICKELNIRDLVLHDGYIPLIYHKDWHLKKAISFWKEFADELPSDFTVYIENVFDDEPDLLCETIEGIGDSRYKICLDIGHANAVGKGGTDEVLGWIERMGSSIGHLHLHNNDGTGDSHDHINKGTLEIDKVLQGIMKCCPRDITMTIESRDSEESARYLYEFFK